MNAIVLMRLQGRELLRRRLALALLIGMPLTFYLTSAGAGEVDTELWSAVAGAIGMGFAVCGAAFFCMLASRAIDPRLVLAGWRPTQLILGRLLLLAVVAAVIGGGFLVLMLAMWGPTHPLALAASIGTAAVVSVTAGLAIAALLPREMEGILFVIMFTGVQMGIPPRSAAGAYIPLYGPQELLVRAIDGGSILPPALHALAWAAALITIAILAWWRRLSLSGRGSVVATRTTARGVKV